MKNSLEQLLYTCKFTAFINNFTFYFKLNFYDEVKIVLFKLFIPF